MAKSGLRLLNKGFRDLRNSPGAHRLVGKGADLVADAAGEGFEVRESPSKNRARRVVVPTTPEANYLSASEPARVIAALEAARNV